MQEHAPLSWVYDGWKFNTESWPCFKRDKLGLIPETLEDETEQIRWLVGRAGYWPDIARSQSKYNRPDWHWQLGSTLVIGEPENVPKNPGAVPEGANLETKDLHIAQAIELCRGIWRDKTQPAADRSLALCWLAHLVADLHQPCHAGSLYSPKLFPEGDRGANSIPTKQSRNMHSLWDGLLGPRFDAGDVRGRQFEIESNEFMNRTAIVLVKASDEEIKPMAWLSESAEYGRSHIYASEVLEPIKAAEAQGTTKLEPLDLSKEFLKAAREVARIRAAFAAQRLAAVLREELQNLRSRISIWPEGS